MRNLAKWYSATLLILAAVGTFLGCPTSLGSTWGVAAISCLLALAFVGLFDVWLPRGDTSEMGGAIAFAAGLLLPVPIASAAIAASQLLVWLMKGLRRNAWRVADDTSRQLVAMIVSSALFHAMGRVTLSGSGDAGLYLRVLLPAAVFMALDMVLSQVGTSLRLSAPLLPLMLGSLRFQGWMAMAQLSAGVLAVLTYESMSVLGVIIVVCLLLVMRQSFSLLVDVRQAYRSTIEALARAIEAQDPRRRGHAERVARLATEVGRLLGFHGKRLEGLTYAALFHDVGHLANEGNPHGDSPVAPSADVVDGVRFLACAVHILRIIDTNGVGMSSQNEQDLVSAYVVTRLSELDDELQESVLSSPPPSSERIGARLYLTTRRDADKAIRRIEARVRAARLAWTPVELEEAW